MSNSKKDLHKVLSDLGPLFDNSSKEGSLDTDLALRDSLIKSMSGCRDSRFQIAAKISELTNHNLSKDMLDKFVSNNTDYDFKAKDLTAFCAVTGNLNPFQVLLAPLSCDVLTPADSKLVRLARLSQEKNRLNLEIARLETELGVGKGRN